MTIRARLLLLILFATLVPALVGGIQFVERRDAEIASAQRDLNATAQRVAQVLNDTVRATVQLHYGLARARDLDTQDRAACSAFLANVLQAHPQYTGILTVNPDGSLFCDSLRSGRTLNLTDRRYFRDALQPDAQFALEPAFGRLTGSAVLQIAYAARDDTGTPKFVLLASLDLEKFMQLRATSLPREAAVISLVDEKGTVLTWHPKGDKLRGTSMADSPVLRFAREQQGADAREFTEAGGATRIWATSALPEFPEAGLHVLVGVSKKELLAAANRNMERAMAILAVVSLLVFVGAWALADRGIRRQTARVITTAARFSAGDLGARVGKPYPSGEIGGLMVALDHAFELTQTERERVIQNTQALARANRVLKMLSEANQSLVQAPDEDSLNRDLCRIVVEFGAYLKCWVGYAEHDPAQSIRPIAQAGYATQYLEQINLTWADRERGHGPMGRAIRDGIVLTEKYIPAGPDSDAWRERALREGYAALIALPIRSGGRILGCLMIYATEPDRFDDQEVKFLVALAADLGYGIDTLRNRVVGSPGTELEFAL